MRRFLITLFLLCAVLAGAYAGRSLAGWGSGGCAPVGVPAMVSFSSPQSEPYRWVESTQDKDQVHLFQGPRQMGTWRKSLKQYFPFNGQTWGEPGVSPLTPPNDPCGCCTSCECTGSPCPCQKTAKTCKTGCLCVVGSQDPEGKTNFGIDKKGWKQEPRMRDPLKEELPQDQNLLRITVIGPEGDRQKVLTDLKSHPSLTPYRNLVWNSYPPNHWAMRPGFVTTGKPTIYVQNPEGKVLHRQDEYRGPEKLAEALRKVDPNYNPQNDPDLNKAPFALPFKWDEKWLWQWGPVVLLGLVILYLINGKKV